MTENTLYKTLSKEWLKEKKMVVAPSTYANFVLILENHLLDEFGNEKIGSISETMIQNYIFRLYDSGRLDGKGGLSIKSIRDIILVLRLSLQYAYYNKLILPLNWDTVKYPKETEIHKVISLSREEEQRLIQTIYIDLDRKKAGILMALFTGLRIGELCGLQMKDISLQNKTISVNKTVQRIYNKQSKKSEIHIGLPKTTSSIREIPMPDMLINVIKKYHTGKDEDFFLTGKKKPTEPRTYRQFFERFLRKNELPDIRFHEIRHTFAVRAIEIPEFDIKSLSEILGHKNVSFTLNVYGRANLSQKVKCMNLLNDLL